MTARIWAALGVECIIFAALLFGGAGTFRWPAAWVFLALFFGCAVLITRSLARRDPALLAERMRPPTQEGQPLWDKIFLPIVGIVWCVWFVLMGIDAVRFHWSSMPLWLQLLGALAIVVAYWLIHRTFVANPFAIAVVKVQHERDHTVISTGPYAIVRHPMYAGAIMIILAIALMLGSWYGVAASLLLIGGVVFRASMEDLTLQRELLGYAAYAERVRYRIMPRIW